LIHYTWTQQLLNVPASLVAVLCCALTVHVLQTQAVTDVTA